MYRKIASAILLACLVGAASLKADETKKDPEKYSGGFTIGPRLTGNGLGGNDVVLNIGYINDFFLVDFGAGFQTASSKNYAVFSNDFGVKISSRNYVVLSSNLGLRNRLTGNLFATYGATGTVWTGSLYEGQHKPYSVGIFAGLDLQLTRHFLLSAKINPYQFQRFSYWDAHSLFQTGSVGVSYVF